MAFPSPYAPTADNTAITADTTRYTTDGGIFVPWVFNPASLRSAGTKLYEIPIANAPCALSVDLPAGTFGFRLVYADADEGGWILDISDAAGNPLACGIPLVTGLNLLKQYAYLGIGGRLFIMTPGDPAAVPGFNDLGAGTRLYFEAA